MVIKIMASSSKGNSYYLSDGETSLLIEAGLKKNNLKESLWVNEIRLSGIDGCIVSHEHL